MWQYVNYRVADRIKLFIRWLIILLLLTGDTNLRKKILWEEFEWAFMQELPRSTAVSERVQEFDVVFQQASTYDQENYYPDRYMIGIYQHVNNRFERIHLLKRVNPFREYKLVKAISDLYQSDSTYLDVLMRNRKNELESIVYRKIKANKRTELDMEYIMWKKEKIFLGKNGFKTKLIEKWNSHLFN